MGHGMPIVNKCMAVLFMSLSAMIIWSEATIIFDYYGVEPYLSIPALINRSVNGDASIVFPACCFVIYLLVRCLRCGAFILTKIITCIPSN